MENATKALLIAAAVLVAIVLIGIGVSLLTKSGETTNQAGSTANMLDTATNSKVDTLSEEMQKL